MNTTVTCSPTILSGGAAMLYTKLTEAGIGAGPKTIAKLSEAGLKTAEAVLAIGLQGLNNLKIFAPVAGKILEVAAANPTPAEEVVVVKVDTDDFKAINDVQAVSASDTTTDVVAEEAAIVTPEPAKPAARKGLLAQKLEAAAAANGTTVDAIREAAAKNQPPAPKAEPAKAPVPRAQPVNVNFLDVGLETPTDLTSPVQLRAFFDQLPNGTVPESARYIKNLFPVCTMCRAAGMNPKLVIDGTFVLVITHLDGKTTSGIFCADHITVAHGQAKGLVEAGKLKSAKMVSLREAWATLTRAYRAQVDEAREERYRKERHDRRISAILSVMEDLGSVTSEHWLTDAQLGSYASPFEVPVFTFGLEEKQARELHLLPNDKEKGVFKGRWGRFFDEYGMRLTMKKPVDLTAHDKLVQHLRDDAKEAQATPFFPVFLVRRFFGDELGWRYLAVHELVLTDFVRLYAEAHKFQVRNGAMVYEWLTRRWEVQREEAAKAAAQAFGKSAEGKALTAFLTAAADDELADSKLLVAPAKK